MDIVRTVEMDRNSTHLLSTYDVQASFQALHVLTHLLHMAVLGGDTRIMATLKVREMGQRLLQ